MNSTALVFEREQLDGESLGLKVQLSGPAGPVELKRVGEAVAVKHRARAPQVWVWVFGHDMDLEGPATCVSYVGPGEGPLTEFVDPVALTTYYHQKLRPVEGWH